MGENMTEIKRRLIPPGKGIRSPKKQSVLVPKGMCWHWTANQKKGADADAHWKYWHNADVGAHYVVDDRTIIQCCPDTEVVWHAGGGPTTDYARKKYPAGTNSSLIGVELCVNIDGNWESTYQNAVHLGTVKCIEYGWSPHQNFERHYDCTKKDCPKMWTSYVPGGEEAWKRFLDDVAAMVKTMKGETALTVPAWKTQIMQEAAETGLIDPNMGHQPDDAATKWFVLAVILNALKVVKTWLKAA